MWTRRRLLQSSLGLAAVGFAPRAWADDAARGLDLAKRTDARADGYVNTTGSLEMILRDAKGRESVRRLWTASLEVPDDADKTLLRFIDPADVKGAVLLTHNHRDRDDEQWMYLPALSRVRRISTSSRSGPFMGSEFAFEDLTRPTVEKYSYRWMREEALDGEACDVIERVPLSAHSGYIKSEVWIDKAQLRVQQATFYDRKSMHLKTLRNTDFQLFEGRFWRPLESTMVNHQTKKSTVLRTTEVSYGTDISEDAFRSDALEMVSRSQP